MVAEINEPINVVASFANGKITPIAFSWHGRRYDHLSLTSQWPVMEGKYAVRCFSLYDGANAYEIRFKTQQMEWELVRIHSD